MSKEDQYAIDYEKWMKQMPKEESLEDPKEEIKEDEKKLDQFSEARKVLEEWEKETWSDEDA